MKLLQMRLRRFGSFVEEQEFRFPEGTGLFFMQGINEVEPRLEANGSGKSTIWNALTWLLFGKTARGLEAGDAANWEEGEGASVELDVLMDHGKIWTIRRSWKPNRWELVDSIFNHVEQDLAKDEANPVLAAIRLKFKPWLSSVLMAQGMPMFLDLGASQKAELFSEVMGLDRWLDCSERASKATKKQDGESRALERELAQLSGRFDALVQQDMSESVEEWEAQRTRRLDEVEKRYRNAMDRLGPAQDEAVGVGEMEKTAREAYHKALGAFDEMRGCEDSQRELLSAAKADLAVARDRADGFQYLGRTCATCGQDIPKNLKEAHSRRHDRAQVDLMKAELEVKGLEEDLKKVREQVDYKEHALKQARQGMDIAVNAVKDRRRALELLERDLDRMEEEAEEIGKEINPYKQHHENAQREAADIRNDMRSVKRALDASNERHSMFAFWVRGFKEVRLQEIGEALQELEIEVNSEVMALGLVGWELRFDLDRETKSGKLQRGFSVHVRSPHNERLVPWEAWSGGESQRLRLAANMGLANLIRARSGTLLNIEVWDEPTQWMSAGGVLDLLNVLKARAIREQRQIWLVDHRSLGYGDFDGTCTIAKTMQGSVIRRQRAYS